MKKKVKVKSKKGEVKTSEKLKVKSKKSFLFPFFLERDACQCFWFIIFSFAFLLLPFFSQAVNACDKDSNEPNERCSTRLTRSPNEPNDPVELLRCKWDAVTSILKNEEIDEKVKEKKINKILFPLFDFSLMAKLSLGRKHWPKLTSEQQEKFTELFIQRIKSTYRDKIESYTDEKLLFKKPLQKSNRITYVPTELMADEKKIEILYKLRQVEIKRNPEVPRENSEAQEPQAHHQASRSKKVYKRWKIYDVQIKEVSILMSYRAQFDDILSHGSVDDLLSKLREQADKKQN